ncbi:hypothetical protein [Flavobacterium silvaticum]|uniref:Uncharacterized protein n=1 Tax=Flavobacterium silvaticum TaxID=1852020 RepID=A0A972FL97_9FLAO|nr:hypothetical protein [Flavobacterium silvaticum]NMH28066.1 hypothetical protein [Flavobacterium silvaticum]
MPHAIIKPTKAIKIDFDPSNIPIDIIPKESLELVKRYLESDELAEESQYDIYGIYPEQLIFGFDLNHEGEKLFIPELNPILIFFSSAAMSFPMLNLFRKKLFENAANLRKPSGKKQHPAHFSDFAQMAMTCIINAQASIECFANSVVPIHIKLYNSKNHPIKRPSFADKVEFGFPQVKEIDFADENPEGLEIIKQLILLRNAIVHFKPEDKVTNTHFKKVYRRLINFDYFKALNSIESFINFYEPNLIEECKCGVNYFYDVISHDKTKDMTKPSDKYGFKFRETIESLDGIDHEEMEQKDGYILLHSKFKDYFYYIYNPVTKKYYWLEYDSQEPELEKPKTYFNEYIKDANVQ